MKRNLAGALGLILGLSVAGAAVAQEVPARVEVASLLRATGCSTSMDGLLSSGAMDPNRLQSALNEMLSLGFMEFTADGGLALTPAICGLSAAPGEAVMTQAVRLNGCVMAEANAEALLADFGLDRSNATPFAEALIASGAATLTDGEIFRLSPAVCAGAELAAAPVAAEPFDARAVLVLALANNGCAMSETEAEVLLPPLGLTMDTAETVADALIAEGLARFDGESLIGTPQLCIGMGVDTAPVTMAMTGTPRDRFIQMMADNGCSITETEFEAVMVSYGLTEDNADTVAEAFIDASQGMVMGEVFILDRSVCDLATPGAVPTSAPSSAPSSATEDETSTGALSPTAPSEAPSAATSTGALSTGALAPPAVPASPKDVFVAAIRANGCSITQDEATVQQAAIGLTMREMDQLADDLMDLGEASVVAGALILTPEVCAAGQAGVKPAVSSEAAPTAEAAADLAVDVAAVDAVVEAPVAPQTATAPAATLPGFVSAVYANGCRMSAPTARAYAAETGASSAQVQAIGDTLIALNLAREEGDVFMLSEEYCAAYRP